MLMPQLELTVCSWWQSRRQGMAEKWNSCWDFAKGIQFEDGVREVAYGR